jgi:hypothetical protein
MPRAEDKWYETRRDETWNEGEREGLVGEWWFRGEGVVWKENPLPLLHVCVRHDRLHDLSVAGSESRVQRSPPVFTNVDVL